MSNLTTNQSEQTKSNETVSKTQVYNLIILDKSGSMSSIARAAISGFNETVGGIRAAQEKFKDTQEHFVSLMVFCNCEKRLVYDKVPVDKIPELTSKDYRPCCCTPLYDAMGISLSALRNDIKDKNDATAVVTIITDGLENASKEYRLKDVKALVEDLTDNEGWTFAYIGTNQDVDKVSEDLSIRNSMAFTDNEAGMSEAWEREKSSRLRCFSRISDNFLATQFMTSQERKLFRSRENAETKYFGDENENENDNDKKSINSSYFTETKERFTPDFIKELRPNEIFVFGSNLAGHHGGGASHIANVKFGAEWGVGVGPTGQCYAIPTMHGGVEVIKPYVDDFVEYAKQHPEQRFLVTRIGCGTAGFKDKQMAPLFAAAKDLTNVTLPKSFWAVLNA